MPESDIPVIAKLKELTASKSFLGQEFLTWLWFRIEEYGGDLQLRNKKFKSDKVEIWIDNKITLESQSSDVSRHLLRGGQPSISEEATVALLSGKLVKEIRLGLTYEEIEYQFTLTDGSLCPQSLGIVVPKELRQLDPAMFFTEKARHIELIIDVLDDLFCQFIDTRTRSNWEDSELDEMREWIQSRSQESKILH